MLFAIYISTVAVALISFVLYFLRINEYLLSKGLICIINKDTIISLIICTIPLINLYFGHEYYYLAIVATDEEFEEYLNRMDDDNEY